MGFKNFEESIVTLNVDKLHATLYTEITYILKLKNIFNFNMMNINFNVPIPSNTKLKNNSFYLNNKLKNIDSSYKINIENLHEGEVIEFKYTVVVSSIPQNGKIENYLEITYENQGQKSIFTNYVSTLIKGVNIIIEKYLNSDVYYSEDPLEEYVKISNIGNIPALNVKYTEVLPQNVQVKEVKIENNFINPENIKDVLIGNLAPNSTVYILIKGRINNLIAKECKLTSILEYNFYDDYNSESLFNNSIEKTIEPNFEVDVLGTENMVDSLIVNKDFLTLEDKGSGLFNVSNLGTIDLEDIELYIDNTNSLKLSEFKINDNNFTPINKVTNENGTRHVLKLDKISSREYINLRFTIGVNDLSLDKNQIVVKIKYKVFNKSLNEYKVKTFESNIVNIPIYSILSLDKDFSIMKNTDRLNYKNNQIIKNTIEFDIKGNLNFVNMIFKEEFTKYAIYIPETLMINGKSYFEDDIYKGIEIKNLNKNQKVIITYDLKIDSNNEISQLKTLSHFEFNNTEIGIVKPIDVYSDIIKINSPSMIEKDACKIVNEYSYDSEIIYKTILENNGNVLLKNISLSLNVIDQLEISEIKINSNEVINAVNKSSINNKMILAELKPSESVEVLVSFLGKNESIDEYFLINSKIGYSYLSEETNELNKEEFYTEEIAYKIVKPIILTQYTINKNLHLKSKEIEGMLYIKNIGNTQIELTNLEKKENSISIDDPIFKGFMSLDKILAVNEEVILPIKVKIDKENVRDLEVKTNYNYYVNNEIRKNEVCCKSNEIKVISDNISCEITNNKEIYSSDETISYSMIINNKGNTDLIDVTLFLDLSDKFDLNDMILTFKSNQYTGADIANGIYIGDVKKYSAIYLTLKCTLGDKYIGSELTAAFKVEGSYKDIINKEEINIGYNSKSLELFIHKMGIERFITSNKEVLLNGESITYKTTLINTSTMPIALKYNLVTGVELEEVMSKRLINGENIKNQDYIIEVDVNDGVIIENSFIYRRFKGINSTIVYGVVEILNKNDELEGETTYITDKIVTTLTNTTFKEIIIEENINPLEFEGNIKEILNLYVSSRILNYNISSLYRDYNYYKKENVGYKLDFIGEVVYSLEYLQDVKSDISSREDEDSICIYSNRKLFNSTINLPEDYVNGESIDMSCSIMDSNTKLLSDSQVYITLNLLASTNL